MDMHEKLKQAGFNPPQKPKKIDSKNANIKMKVEEVGRFLSCMEMYEDKLNGAPDEFTFRTIQNSIVLYYEKFCIGIKDILDNIAKKENITNISEHRGLGELIRNTMSCFNLTPEVEQAVRRLTVRNNVAHDYMNAEYYDDIVLKHVTNDISNYKLYLQCIKDYLIRNKMINK